MVGGGWFDVHGLRLKARRTSEDSPAAGRQKTGQGWSSEVTDAHVGPRVPRGGQQAELHGGAGFSGRPRSSASDTPALRAEWPRKALEGRADGPLSPDFLCAVL